MTLSNPNYDFYLVIGDTNPVMQETLQNGDGTVPDLTGATIQLVIQDEAHAHAPFGGAATPVGSPTAGRVQYVWQPSDSTTPGIYHYRWRVTFPSAAGPETYPNGKDPRRLLISPIT